MLQPMLVPAQVQAISGITAADNTTAEAKCWSYHLLHHSIRSLRHSRPYPFHHSNQPSNLHSQRSLLVRDRLPYLKIYSCFCFKFISFQLMILFFVFLNLNYFVTN